MSGVMGDFCLDGVTVNQKNSHMHRSGKCMMSPVTGFSPDQDAESRPLTFSGNYNTHKENREWGRIQGQSSSLSSKFQFYDELHEAVDAIITDLRTQLMLGPTGAPHDQDIYKKLEIFKKQQILLSIERNQWYNRYTAFLEKHSMSIDSSPPLGEGPDAMSEAKHERLIANHAILSVAAERKLVKDDIKNHQSL